MSCCTPTVTIETTANYPDDHTDASVWVRHAPGCATRGTTLATCDCDRLSPAQMVALGSIVRTLAALLTEDGAR